MIRRLTLAALACALLGGMTVAVTYLVIRPSLPDMEMLRDVRLQVPLRIYSRDGKLMQVFGEKHRNPLSLEEIPACIKNAFLAGEDARFYEHPGVDYQGILRAVWHLVKTGGDKGPGGSTITQQLARDFGFVSRRKLYTRKIKEIFLALKMEAELSKDEIFELYLNKIYLGNRAYGVAAAAHAYYGKRVDELEVPECAMIASLPKAPSRINPINNPPRAIERRNYVIGRMAELGYITRAQADQALVAEDYAFPHEPSVEVEAPYAAEIARARAVELLGEDAYTGGFQVHTTFDSRLQRTATDAVRSGLVAYDRRHGYRGPIGHFDLEPGDTPADWSALLDQYQTLGGMRPALIVELDEDLALAYLDDGQTITLDFEAVSWARPFESTDRVGPRPETVGDVVSVGDVVRVSRGASGAWELAQVPEVEGALISMRPENGAVLAVVGGFDFSKSKFNRATQARRQPGSSFKPFVYSAALTHGFTPATLVNDAPVVFESEALERVWRPENYSQQFYGPTRLREGMVNSRNLVSIRVLRDVGVDYVWEYVTRFGFDPEELPRDLSMALGSGAVYPITMARAYSILANGGYFIEPYFIERIVNGSGETIYRADPMIACKTCEDQAESEPQPMPVSDPAGQETLQLSAVPEEPEINAAPRIMDEATNFMINSLLQDVVRRGTGKRALELGRGDLAGKTGTTNDQRDAWFSGFNGAVATSAWVGFDTPRPLGRGEVGGRAAL
ncbi:MAG: PBP1A family penicillin-binding protein, partial [Xanthomonadales bacterium]|nr:PBP1A family penicillin-binding protein [Xanthomonadales bacterium]